MGFRATCVHGCRQATSLSQTAGFTVLHLKSSSNRRWLQQVDAHFDEILIDHAHCEKKAAGTALNLIFHYVENEELCREMASIVVEELEHFQMVVDLLKRRGIRFRRLKPSQYGRKLNDLVRRQEPQRAVDRLLVAGLIEARSCERFQVLAEHVADPEIAAFYRGLFESEARHHATYTRLAMHVAPEADVIARLDELAELEAAIMDEGEELPRMHS
jgi:tRNA-(ms[2]io[6]A)-hydroxylase